MSQASTVREQALKQALNLQTALNSKDGKVIMAALEKEYGKETSAGASSERMVFLCGAREVLGYMRDVSTSTYDDEVKK